MWPLPLPKGGVVTPLEPPFSAAADDDDDDARTRLGTGRPLPLTPGRPRREQEYNTVPELELLREVG